MDTYLGELIQRGRSFSILIRWINGNYRVIQTWQDAGRVREQRIMSAPTLDEAKAMAREVINTSDGIELSL